MGPPAAAPKPQGPAPHSPARTPARDDLCSPPGSMSPGCGSSVNATRGPSSPTTPAPQRTTTPGSRQLRSPWRDESVADLFQEWTKRCPVLAASSTTTSEPLDAQVKVDVRVLGQVGPQRTLPAAGLHWLGR